MRHTWLAAVLLVGCQAHVLVAPLRYAETAPPAADARRDATPALVPVHDVTDDAPRETTLPNGLRVLLVTRHDVPVVALRLVIARGAVDVNDPGANATSQMAFFYQRGGDELAFERTTREAARLTTRVERWNRSDGQQLAVKVGAGDLAAGVALLGDLALGADLTPAEYERLRTTWTSRATHLRSMDSAMQRAMLFGAKSPYGHAGWGRRLLTREQLVDLRAHLFQPAQTTLVVVGDVSPESVDAAVAHTFGAWAGTTTIPSATTPPLPTTSDRLAWRHAPLMTQSYASIFYPGPAPASDDMDAFRLAAVLLGAPTSRLFVELREDQGAAYAPGASVREERAVSWVSFESLYDPSRMVHGLHTIIDRVRALRGGAITDDEVAAAREGLLAGWRHEMATASGTASRYAEAVLTGRSVERVRAFPARLEELGKRDLVRCANLYLTEARMRVAVISSGPDIELGTLGLGPLGTVDVGGN